MAFDAEQRESEARKLDALTMIGTSIVTLATSLTNMFRENQDQTLLLKHMDQKLDRILVATEAKGSTDERR